MTTNSRGATTPEASCPGCGKSTDGSGAIGATFTSSHGTRYVCWACSNRANRSRTARRKLDAAMRAAVGLASNVKCVDHSGVRDRLGAR